MAYVNPCGGVRWQTLQDGSIEIEGQGVPVYVPTDAKYPWMTRSWSNWSPLILNGSSAHGIPPNWILGVMSLESGLWSGNAAKQAQVVSSAGARGLMQVMPQTAIGLGFNPDDMFIPALAIDAGAKLLAQLAKQTGGELPAMAAAYNSGKVCNDGRFSNQWNLAMDGDYAGIVSRFNNTALQDLNLSPRPPLLAGVAVGAAGLYAAAVIAGFVALPRFLRT